MNKKLLAIVIPIIVVIIAALGVLSYLLLTSDNKPEDLYLEKIQTADKYLSNNDYDNAILYYQKAIEADGTKQEPYIALADIYYVHYGDINQALAILRQGYDRTQSADINLLIAKYEGFLLTDDVPEPAAQDAAKKDNVDSNKVFDSQLLDVIATNTYGDYTAKFSQASYTNENGKYTVKYHQISAAFEYENLVGRDPILNPATGVPFDNVRPTKIVFDDLSTLMPAVASGLSVDGLRSYGVAHFDEKSADDEVDSDYIVFEYHRCEFTLAVGADRCVTYPNGYNSIIPPVNMIQEQGKVTVAGSIIDVTNGHKVDNAKVSFFKGTASGERFDPDTNDSGEYSVQLEPDNYVARIEADGYITEEFSFTVTENSDTMALDFSISPQLSAGQIRIVLEWGANPSDLDSHLTGTASDGRGVSVDFISPTARSGDKVYAELDIDDRSGFGPETITINDVNGKYDYFVYLYAGTGTIAQSGATVKVYTSDSASPITFVPPANHTGVQWDVFSIDKGEITIKDADTV